MRGDMFSAILHPRLSVALDLQHLRSKYPFTCSMNTLMCIDTRITDYHFCLFQGHSSLVRHWKNGSI